MHFLILKEASWCKDKIQLYFRQTGFSLKDSFKVAESLSAYSFSGCVPAILLSSILNKQDEKGTLWTILLDI